MRFRVSFTCEMNLRSLVRSQVGLDRCQMGDAIRFIREWIIRDGFCLVKRISLSPLGKASFFLIELSLWVKY